MKKIKDFRNYSTQSFTVADFEEILNYQKFDRNKQTAIYSYGFTQTVNQPSVRGIVDAYLENGDFNFVLVNYNSILAYTVLVRRHQITISLNFTINVFLVEYRSVCRQNIRQFTEAFRCWLWKFSFDWIFAWRTNLWRSWSVCHQKVDGTVYHSEDYWLRPGTTSAIFRYFLKRTQRW